MYSTNPQAPTPDRGIPTRVMQPFTRKASSTTSRWFAGGLVTFLVDGEDTGGQLACIEATVRRGTEPPMHIHRREDETILVLDGELDYIVGDQTYTAASGGCVFVPRNIPHTYRQRTDIVKALLILTPAGLEGFFKELSEPAAILELPPMPPGPPDPAFMADFMAKVKIVAERYGTDFLA